MEPAGALLHSVVILPRLGDPGIGPLSMAVAVYIHVVDNILSSIVTALPSSVTPNGLLSSCVLPSLALMGISLEYQY